MPTARVPIADGQVASAEDQPAYARLVTNFLSDDLGFQRLRPAVVNNVFDPASNANTSGSATNIIGSYVWTNPVDRYDYLIYVRADRKIFAKNLVTLLLTPLSDATTATKLEGSSSHPTFAEDSGRIMIAGGGQIQTWTGVLGTLSSRLAAFVIGVNEPPRVCTFLVKLANYVIANNQYPGSLNQFIWSALGDGVDGTWPPLNFNTADARPDPVLAVYENLRELYLFGSSTVQVYGITADADLPFQASAAVGIGTIAPYSIIRLDAEFAMLDNQRRFVITNGRSFDVISEDIDKTVRDLATVTDCHGYRVQIGFWDLLLWVFPTVGTAFYYEKNQKKWGSWRGWNGIDDWAALRLGCYVYWPAGNLHLIGDTQYENVFTFDAATRTDVGATGSLTLPVVAERTTGRLDYDTTKRKRCNSVRICLRRGSALGTSSFVELSKSDDGGPWSAPCTIDLATVEGDAVNWRTWYPGGVYRRRQYKIRYSGAADLVVSELEEDYSIMTS